MKKIFGLFIIGMALIQCTVAQDSEKTGFDKSKLFFGGNLGLAFGTYTIINVSPQSDIIFHRCLPAVSVSIIHILNMTTAF